MLLSVKVKRVTADDGHAFAVTRSLRSSAIVTQRVGEDGCGIVPPFALGTPKENLLAKDEVGHLC